MNQEEKEILEHMIRDMALNIIHLGSCRPRNFICKNYCPLACKQEGGEFVYRDKRGNIAPSKPGMCPNYERITEVHRKYAIEHLTDKSVREFVTNET